MKQPTITLKNLIGKVVKTYIQRCISSIITNIGGLNSDTHAMLGAYAKGKGVPVIGNKALTTAIIYNIALGAISRRRE
jgi:hypothetical protein